MSTTAQVSEFYGKTVQQTADLQYDACCTIDYDPALLQPLTDEVRDRRYGCGSPFPALLDGLTVLDLGCGAGIDVYIAAQLVGEQGKVVGVDMTQEQLDIAQRNVAPIMSNLGYARPNVEFHLAQIESLPLEDASVDVVISNCVINLSPHKDQVFAEIARVLRPGGEFYISDIVADRRIPDRLKADERLYSECLTGAAYEEDLRRIMAGAGFADVRVVQRRRLSDVIEGIRFDSVYLRGFKIDLEDACEDYGQVAVYKGTIPDHVDNFVLDGGHVFRAGEPVRVCKNSADMLAESRYAAHFAVSAPMFHMGLFDCSGGGACGADGTAFDAARQANASSNGGGCC